VPPGRAAGAAALPAALGRWAGGAPRRDSDESLLLIALLRTLWRLSPRAMADWLRAWPALAFACGLPARADGMPWAPCPSQQWKRATRAAAPPCETLFVHTALGAVAVIPFTPTATKDLSCLPPTWTKEELGKRSGIERFFGRVFLFFRLQRPPLSGWSAVTCQVALTDTAVLVVALIAHDAGRPDLIGDPPARVLAHCWEGLL